MSIVNKCAEFDEDILKRYRLKFGSVGVFFNIFASPRWSVLRMRKKWCHHFDHFSQDGLIMIELRS